MVDDETIAGGATVKIFNVNDSLRTPEKQTATNDNGMYSFDGLTKGTYNV
ncbi:MAG: hypothetical protein HQK83_08130 [Fibrobacteria bacterium]|nr:hypothetical protein [Fibrobacteria bacterium]